MGVLGSMGGVDMSKHVEGDNKDCICDRCVDVVSVHSGYHADEKASRVYPLVCSSKMAIVEGNPWVFIK